MSKFKNANEDDKVIISGITYMCGDKREPTESERLQFNIGSKQSYIESLSNKTR